MPIVICTQPALDIIEIVGIAQGNPLDEIAIPSGTAIGDVTYVIHFGDTEADPSAISGWTTLATGSVAETSRVSRMVWASTPPATVEGGDFNGESGWISITLRNVNATPEDATTTTASGIDGTLPNPPSITTVTNKCLIIVMGVVDSGVSGPSAPSGFENIRSEGATFFGPTVMLATKQQGSAGAIDPGMFGGFGGEDWNAYTIAVRPA